MAKQRRTFSEAFKAKVALAAIRAKAVAELKAALVSYETNHELETTTWKGCRRSSPTAAPNGRRTRRAFKHDCISRSVSFSSSSTG